MSEFLVQGELVGIRPIAPNDARLVYVAWHDPDVQRNLDFVDNDSFEVWLEKERAADHRCWLECIVTSLADGEPAGYVSLGCIGKEPQLVILLLPAYRGRGMGTEASRLIIDYGFATMGLSYIEAGTNDFNATCQAMLGKLGFARDPEQDESADSVWGEGKVTELGYRLDREAWQQTRNWQDRARPAVFDARPALETIKQLDIIRVCGSEGETRAMETIAEGLSALGVTWRYHTFDDWWVEHVDPHLELRGRKLPVRPVLEPAWLSAWDWMSNDALTVDVCRTLAPMGRCDGLIAVAERFDPESPVERNAAAQLMAFGFDAKAEAYLWGQDWDIELVPAAYLRAEDVAFVREAIGEQAALRWGSRRVQRQFRNLVAEIPGTAKPGECIVLGAHIDSFPGTVGSSDDAAGCAVLLEAVKWFAANPPARTVRLAWFTGEEIDCRGSKAYARDFASELAGARLMVNVDTGCEMFTGPAKAYVHDEAWARDRFNLDGMAVHVSAGSEHSDTGAFMKLGVPVFFACGKSKQPAHLPTDRPETIDPHKLQLLGSLNLEAAVHAANAE